MENFGLFVRGICFVVALLVLLFFIWRVVVSFRNYSWGQKFLAGGIIGYMLYVEDALREAIQLEVQWRLRLLPLCIGLVCFVCYICEPSTLARKRWGKDPFRDKDDTL